MNRRLIAFSLVVSACVLSAIPACREKDKEPKIVTITDGRIKRVDQAQNEIVVTYKPEKSTTEVEGKAIINAATEILVNGAPGKLSDLTVGERVSGEVRVDKIAKGKQQLVALKIHIEKAKTETATGG